MISKNINTLKDDNSKIRLIELFYDIKKISLLDNIY